MNEKLLFKMRTQCGIILKEMENNPRKWFTVGYFCGQCDHCFVGYKASSRLGELQKEGILISRWSEKRTVLGAKVKEYRLSPDYSIEYEGYKLRVVKNSLSESHQESLFI